MKASAILVILLLLFLAKFTFGQSYKKNFCQAKSDSLLCVTRVKLFEYYPLDTLFQLVKKPAIKDLISAIKTCGYNYDCETGFQDKACQLLLPNWLDDYSLNFGDNEFFISFDDHDNRTGNCIVLYYDLQSGNQHFFSKQMRKPGQPYDSVITNGKTMYQFKTAGGMHAGEIRLDNNMSVEYYTNDTKTEKQLRICILSCRLE